MSDLAQILVTKKNIKILNYNYSAENPVATFSVKIGRPKICLTHGSLSISKPFLIFLLFISMFRISNLPISWNIFLVTSKWIRCILEGRILMTIVLLFQVTTKVCLPPIHGTTMRILLWNANGSIPINESHINYTMHEKEYNTLCAVDDATNSSSVCNSGGLGLSLSTPILMLSCGVLGNMIALVVLYTARKDMKSTVFYTLLFALAVTDLIGQLLTGPIAIIVYANNLQWVGGEPLCKYHAFCMIFFGMITPLFVCLMSFERLLALRFAYFHARVVTRKKARVAILICWISVSLFCSLPFMGFGSYEHQFPGSWCFLNFHKESTTDIAYAYTYAVLNITFILTIILCNSAVVITLLKMRKTRVLNNSPSLERRHGTKPKTKKFEEETQMVWFLCAITLVFSTCYLPLNVSNQIYIILFLYPNFEEVEEPYCFGLVCACVRSSVRYAMHTVKNG